MRHLTIDDIKIPKPDLASAKAKKGQVIVQWLIEWVKYSLEHGIADIGDFIPSKQDLASFLDVSSATIQNSIRQVKNLGYFISKQSLGTCINDFYSKDIKDIDTQNELQTSSITECKIKKIILEEKIPLGNEILSIKMLSYKTQISQNTIRLALSNLEQLGFLEKRRKKGNKYHWIYIKEFKFSRQELSCDLEDENFTLTYQLVRKIQDYIEKSFKQGQKIPSNSSFCSMFNVSIKTVNDAMKILNSKKIVLSRRGRYGTIYLGKQNSKKDFISVERKKPIENYIYSWQKALVHLKKYIIENYETGDKIAPIRQLAQILNVSPNTIRRALQELFQNGYLVSQRGKTGGIFITDMPEAQEDNYRWLALNPEVVGQKFN